MAKILTGQELMNLIKNEGPRIDDKDQYVKFINDLATLVTDHFGGKLGVVEWDEEMDDVAVGISRDENLPEGETVYDGYDPEGKL